MLTVSDERTHIERRTDRRSNSGNICGINGGAIAWSCKKQNLVTLFSTEAEYVALTEACKELIWIRRLGQTLNLNIEDCSTIFIDSQSSFKLLRIKSSVIEPNTRFQYIKN